MHAVLLLLACASSSAQLLVVQCGGTNDRFGRLHIDVLPRLQATIKLVAAATATRQTVRVLTSGGLNETLHLGIARGPGPALTRPHWSLVADALLESGLPKAALLQEGVPALTTVDEAIMTREHILRAHSHDHRGKRTRMEAAPEAPLRFTDVAVVTSEYHGPRVAHLFGRALAPCAGVRVRLRIVTVPEGRLVTEAAAPAKFSLLDTAAIRMRAAHEEAALSQLRSAPNGEWLNFLKLHGGTACTASTSSRYHEPSLKVASIQGVAADAPDRVAKTGAAAATAAAAVAAAAHTTVQAAHSKAHQQARLSESDVARGRNRALLYILISSALLPLSVGASLLCRRLGLVHRPVRTYGESNEPIVASHVVLSSGDAAARTELSKGGDDGSSVTKLLFAAGIVCAFISLNSALSLLNRWALGVVGGLQLPLIMTASHMIFGPFALAPLMILHDGYASTLLEELRCRGKALAAIGVMNALQIGLNNASLVWMELSLNQVIRATGPVVTSCILICLEGAVPSRGEALCLLLISGGAVTTVYSGLGRSTAIGVILTATSTLTQCLQISVSGRMMHGRGKLDAFQMTVLTGPISFFAILPMALASEFGVLSAALATQPITALSFLLGSCMLAVAYNVTLFQALATLSTTGTSILGNVKIVLLLFLSALFLDELRTWSTSQLLGCALTFIASGCYSRLKLLQAR